MPVSISLDDAAEARAWFAGVVEPLADSFDAADVGRYVDLFTEVLAAVDRSYNAEELSARFERIRYRRRFAGPDPEDVFVLSRVTLGADVAITSVLLDAAKRRFPRARIWYVGPVKGFELFAGDPRILHAPVTYQRTGSIRSRIHASSSLCKILGRPRSIVLDPDSRLTQLGLIPVCPEEEYFLFETRSSPEPGSLSTLMSRWTSEVLGVEPGNPYVALPGPKQRPRAEIAISLGVGENPAKRIPDPFERLFMERVAATGRSAIVDRGAGGEESDRVQRATAGLATITNFEGSFAAFAACIENSTRYIGYDSAGQHVAAACGVPLLTVFAGYPNPRFMERWRPSGPGPITVLDGNAMEPATLAEEIAAWLE